MPDFLSKAREGLRKGVTTATVKSRELMDAQKLKGHINKLEEDKKTALQELGSLVYDMSAADKLDKDAIRQRCAVITDISAQIKESNGQLDEVHRKAQEAAGKGPAD